MAKIQVKALGVWLSVDSEETDTLNYNKKKLEKLRTVLSCWKYDRLTQTHQRSKQTFLLIVFFFFFKKMKIEN